MKQKSILWSLFTLIMVAMISAAFVACGDDDDDNGSASGVVGSWSGRDGREYLTLTFKSGGSGVWTERYNDSYSGMETHVTDFTYVMEGKSKGIITIEEYDSYYGTDTEHYFFVIEGKTMKLYEDDYGVDLEWELTKN